MPKKENFGPSECCVMLCGLPFSAREEEVRTFLAEVSDKIEHMFFTYREGRPTGTAFVRFMDVESTAIAIKKYNNRHIGPRFVEVYGVQLDYLEFQQEAYSEKGENPLACDDEHIVRLRGLPFGCTREDITVFFRGIDIIPNGVLIPMDDSSENVGEAFVQFTNAENVERALKRNLDYIGSRYIEIFKSSEADIKQAMWKLQTGDRGSHYGDYNAGPALVYKKAAMTEMKPRSDPLYGQIDSEYAQSEVGGPMGSGPRSRPAPYTVPVGANKPASTVVEGDKCDELTSHRVNMRGLPFKATEVEVRRFFFPLRIAHIQLSFDERGRPAGEAEVCFHTHEDAVEALRRDRDSIDNRYIDLILNSTPKGKILATGTAGMQIWRTVEK